MIAKESQKLAALALLRNLRVELQGRTGWDEARAKDLIYDVLVQTADEFVAGGEAEAKIAVDLAIAELVKESPISPIVPPPNISLDMVSLVGSKAYYKGRDLGSYADLPITRKMTDASTFGDKVRFKYESLSGWKVEDGLDAHICIVFQSGSELIASRFDHKKMGQTVKELKNINEDGGIISHGGHGYIPSKGQPVGFFLVSHDEKQRTNTVRGGNYP